jgi:hypothetical protein
MKKNILLMMLIIAIITAAACSPASRTETIERSGPFITVIFSFNPESYPRFIKKGYPQIAVWVTQKNMKNSRTLYATESGSRNKWWGADKRPESLPVWYGVKNDYTEKEIDAVTGATPSGESFKIQWSIPAEMMNKPFDVFVEANVSFDYNEHFRKSLKDGEPGFSGVNGQPSVVWKAGLNPEKEELSIEPVIAGHGHVLGASHDIDPDMSKVTTAKDLFHYIKVIYEPGIK